MGMKAAYIILSSTSTMMQAKPKCNHRNPPDTFQEQINAGGELDISVKRHGNGSSKIFRFRM
jgi:hypothetical protein